MKKKPEIEFILLSCCTCKRPKMLADTLNSINLLSGVDGFKIEILIVDNDANKTAQGTVNELSDKIKYPLHYVVEEKSGLANARNRILTEAVNLGASHIFMFDDDEILTENCLRKHIELYQSNNDCKISSGLVINKFDDGTPSYISKNIIFKQKTTKKTGQVKNTCASGNVFLPVAVKKDFNLNFSSEYVYMGGEDGDFFKKASDLGFTIIQNSDSIIYERVTKARANLKYVLKRAYNNGFSGSYINFKLGLKTKNKFFYLLKLLLVGLFNLIILIPSILFGISVFINVLSMLMKTLGKFVGAIKTKPLEFYKEIYGE